MLLAVLAFALKWWVVPALVRREVEGRLWGYWDGSISIGRVEFNYLGPTYLRRIAIRDRSGREWLLLASLAIVPRNHARLRPMVVDLLAEGLELRAHFTGGRCSPPWRRPPQAQQPTRYADIQQVTIGDAAVGFFNEQGRTWSAGGFRLTARLSGSGYAISCLRQPAGSAERFAFAGHSTSLELADLRGEGLIRLEGVGVSQAPVIPGIFEFLGLADAGLPNKCSLEAAFDLAGGWATIRRGRLANPVLALEAQKGGMIDLGTGAVDFYVVAAPFKDVRGLLPSLPPVGPLGQLTDEVIRTLDTFSTLTARLTRLHIKGHWSDPPEKLITKEPLEALQAGTVEFIRQAIESGGRLPTGTLKVFGELLEGHPPTSRAASRGSEY